jgi:signal transduction histidine kinase
VGVLLVSVQLDDFAPATAADDDPFPIYRKRFVATGKLADEVSARRGGRIGRGIAHRAFDFVVREQWLCNPGLLEQRKIKYTAYELPVEKLGAEATALLLGVSPEIVYKTINGTQYKLTLRRSLKENRVLMFSTTFSMIFILFLLFIAFFFTNRYISKKIWTSFYHNLNTIKHFSLTLNPSPLHLLPSKIQEFNELNEAIENLSRKVVSDYRILKEFTENASHETQTPLTVIISRLEILLQSGDLTNGQVKNIYPAYRAAKRLSILNKNLLLLSRIEHERFKKGPVYLDKILITQLNLLDVFIQSKKLTVHFQPPEKHVIFKGNQYQTEILISNLLKNATLHNITGGKISIFLTEKDLIIENTGKPLSIEPDKLFERFNNTPSRPHPYSGV